MLTVTFLLNYNVAVSGVVQLYSCCYQFKCQICLTYSCTSPHSWRCAACNDNVLWSRPTIYSDVAVVCAVDRAPVESIESINQSINQILSQSRILIKASCAQRCLLSRNSKTTKKQLTLLLYCTGLVVFSFGVYLRFELEYTCISFGIFFHFIER